MKTFLVTLKLGRPTERKNYDTVFIHADDEDHARELVAHQRPMDTLDEIEPYTLALRETP